MFGSIVKSFFKYQADSLKITAEDNWRVGSTIGWWAASGCKFEAVRAKPLHSGLLRHVEANKTRLISSSYEKDKKHLQNYSG